MSKSLSGQWEVQAVVLETDFHTMRNKTFTAVCMFLKLNDNDKLQINRGMDILMH